MLRGVTRPGVLVAENELRDDGVFAADAFLAAVVGRVSTSSGSDGLVTMQCEIRYATDGTSGQWGNRSRADAGGDGSWSWRRRCDAQPQQCGEDELHGAAGATRCRTTGVLDGPCVREVGGGWRAVEPDGDGAGVLRTRKRGRYECDGDGSSAGGGRRLR